MLEIISTVVIIPTCIYAMYKSTEEKKPAITIMALAGVACLALLLKAI